MIKLSKIINVSLNVSITVSLSVLLNLYPLPLPSASFRFDEFRIQIFIC